MLNCERCTRSFPDRLIHRFSSNVGPAYDLCPICGLAITNEIHGSSLENFAPGTLSQMWLEEARRLYPETEEDAGA